MSKTIYSEPYAMLLAWLKQGRRMEGVSIRQLADLTKHAKSVIGRIETGERRLDLLEFIQICKVLGLDPHEGFSILCDAVERGRSP
jgi:hypothetical protein